VLYEIIIKDPEQAFVVVPFFTTEVCAVILLCPFQLLNLWENFKKLYMNTMQLDITLTYVTSVMGIFCRMRYNTTAMRNFSVAFRVMKMTNKLLYVAELLKFRAKIYHKYTYTQCMKYYP
jgi:hypothetical protein